MGWPMSPKIVCVGLNPWYLRMWSDFEMACVSFLLLWQSTPEKLLKGGKIYFVSPLQRFQSPFFGPILFGPLVRQNIMVENWWKSRAAHLMATRKQRREEGTRDKIHPKDTPPVTNLLWLSFTSLSFHYVPAVPQLGTNPSTHECLRNIPDLNCIIGLLQMEM